MITFGNPWYLVVLIMIPILYYWQSRVGKNHEGTFRISSIQLISDKMKRRGRRRHLILTILQYVTLCLVVMGLSRPQIRDSLTETNVEVVDIVLVMDILSLIHI